MNEECRKSLRAPSEANNPYFRNPHSQAGFAPDLRVQLDAQRERCPVMHAPDGSITLLSHEDVCAAALDPETFSSAVSAHRAIPNSLDGEEHKKYRALIDKYLTEEEVLLQEPQCQKHASEIIASLPRETTVRTVLDIGTPFAVRTQSTWLSWPQEIEDVLVAWMADNREATRSGKREKMADVAERFDAIITSLINDLGSDTGEDVLSRLMREEIDGQKLTKTEIVSILRNWTAGDLGSLAASVGVIVHHLATDIALQEYLRSLVAKKKTKEFEDAIEEILRIDDPFVSNRRIATKDTEVAGVRIDKGTRVILNWTSANRDPKAFREPDAFNPDEHSEANIVFGIGSHICPGRALTLMELRVIIWELLTQTKHVAMSTERPPVRETPPVSGWAKVPVILYA